MNPERGKRRWAAAECAAPEYGAPEHGVPENVAPASRRCASRAVGSLARDRRSISRAAPRTGPLLGLLLLAGCRAAMPPLTISVDALECAPPVIPIDSIQSIAADSDRLRRLWKPLGTRVGLVQIRTPQQWREFQAVAPEAGRCPDLSSGAVVAIVNCSGTPLSGEWPIELASVRVHNGAGFVSAEFRGGTYLPDGTAYVEMVQVPGLAEVLMVDVNGVRFYTD